MSAQQQWIEQRVKDLIDLASENVNTIKQYSQGITGDDDSIRKLKFIEQDARAAREALEAVERVNQ